MWKQKAPSEQGIFGEDWKQGQVPAFLVSWLRNGIGFLDSCFGGKFESGVCLFILLRVVTLVILNRDFLPSLTLS